MFHTESINILKNPTKKPTPLPISFNINDINTEQIIKLQCKNAVQMPMTIRFLVDISGSMNGLIY